MFLSAKESGRIMLWQIKKILHCHFPDLGARLLGLCDPRKAEQYTLEELVMAAVVLFLLRCDSRNDFNNKCKDEQFRANYRRMFGLNLPHMDAVDALFEVMTPEELEQVRCRLINALIEKRIFHKIRFFDKYFCIGIDATGVYNWGNKPSEEVREFALTKEFGKSKKSNKNKESDKVAEADKVSKVSYFSQVLEAVLICKNGTSIPVITEWIANDGEDYDKQDCESKAFKRLAVRLKKYFPRLNICILADGLYTNVSIMDICKEYEWKFITVFKDGNLPTVWVEIESLLPLAGAAKCHTLQTEDATHSITHTYRWIEKIEYKKHNIAWVECVQESVHIKTGERKENRFVFLTNWGVNQDNIAAIVAAGRARWFIEDHFNTQKNRKGNLHHKFNRKNLSAIKNWHNARQLACMIEELIKHTAELQQLKKENQQLTWKTLWENMNAYLTMLPVEEQMTEFEHWSKSQRQVRLE
jgi:hypothetical protein